MKILVIVNLNDCMLHDSGRAVVKYCNIMT